MDHVQESHSCRYCSKWFPSDVLELHHEFDHRCKFCNQHFSTRDFEFHRVWAHPCPYCSENIAYEKLSAHIYSAHKCPYCQELYNAEQMKLHIAQEHTCNFCHNHYTKDEFRKHVNSLHKCPSCDKLIEYYKLEEHVNLGHRCKYRKCPMCHLVFINTTHLLAHVNLAHGPSLHITFELLSKTLGVQLYQCQKCHVIFDSECKKNYHCLDNSCYPCASWNCANCYTIFKMEDTRSAEINRIKLHECMAEHCAFSKTCYSGETDDFDPFEHADTRMRQICPQVVRTVTSNEHLLLNVYQESSHTWRCPICVHLTFLWIHELKQHRDIAHVCAICDKEVVSKEDHIQKEHKSVIVNYQEGTTPSHRCSFCNKDHSCETFTQHLTSEHRCNYCSRYFKLEELQIHVKLEHKCHYCEVAFHDLFIHLIAEHKCWHCSRWFKTKDLLLSHVYSDHLCYYCCLNLTDKNSREMIDVSESKVFYKCSCCHSYFPEFLMKCFVNSRPICAFCAEISLHLSSKVVAKCEYSDCRAILGSNEQQLVAHKRTAHMCPDCPKFFSCEQKRTAHFQLQHTLEVQKSVLFSSTSHPQNNRLERVVNSIDSMHTCRKRKEINSSTSEAQVFPVSTKQVLQTISSFQETNPEHQSPMKERESRRAAVALVPMNTVQQVVPDLQNTINDSVNPVSTHQPSSDKPKVTQHGSLPNPLHQLVNQQPSITKTLQNTVNQNLPSPVQQLRQKPEMSLDCQNPVHQASREQSHVNAVLQSPVQQSGKDKPPNPLQQQSVKAKPSVTESPENPVPQSGIEKSHVNAVLQSPDGKNSVPQSVKEKYVHQAYVKKKIIVKVVLPTTMQKSPVELKEKSVANVTSLNQGTFNVPLVISGLYNVVEQQRNFSVLFKCGESNCNRMVETTCQIAWHLQRNHRQGCPVICGNCEEILTSERDITKHELVKQHCIYCKESFSSTLKLMAHWDARQKVVICV